MEDTCRGMTEIATLHARLPAAPSLEVRPTGGGPDKRRRTSSHADAFLLDINFHNHERHSPKMSLTSF